ncbi:MAG: cupredoxin domain-containing protein [Ketobacteraceae bacterium]|nr:cupredoxin domain-containing protein [Ketobacteraceae bacterium]
MLIVNIAGLALIGLIVWWFWLYKPSDTDLSGDVLRIEVDKGTYDPSHIRLKAGEPSRLVFFRKDPNPCSETVIFPDLQISKELPAGKETAIELPPLDPGKYAFHCQMQMYKGQLKVE